MTNGMKDEVTPLSTDALKTKCIEDLRREYAKAIEERDEAKLQRNELFAGVRRAAEYMSRHLPATPPEALAKLDAATDLLRSIVRFEKRKTGPMLPHLSALQRKYDHLSEQYAKAITDLNELLERARSVTEWAADSPVFWNGVRPLDDTLHPLFYLWEEVEKYEKETKP